MIYIPCSIGDIVDKITILTIKAGKIKDKSPEIKKEIVLLRECIKDVELEKGIEGKLLKINKEIWDCEDFVRFKLKNWDLDEDFTSTAAAIFILNNHRAAIKSRINFQTNSEIKEYKKHD